MMTSRLTKTRKKHAVQKKNISFVESMYYFSVSYGNSYKLAFVLWRRPAAFQIFQTRSRPVFVPAPAFGASLTSPLPCLLYTRNIAIHIQYVYISWLPLWIVRFAISANFKTRIIMVNEDRIKLIGCIVMGQQTHDYTLSLNRRFFIDINRTPLFQSIYSYLAVGHLQDI